MPLGGQANAYGSFSPAGRRIQRSIAQFRDGAAQFAPSVHVTFLDGVDPSIRRGVWHAADVFISLPDNIQETFGLVVLEAMANGLPVVGSDWDGYRDLVVDGSTGWLVPTRMVRGATAESTARFLFGQVNYDHFLAECSQVVAVDSAAAADALARLVADDTLRSQFGSAGRERVLNHFTWEHVIRAFQSLWAEQEQALSTWTKPRSGVGPANYVAPEVSFAGYPSAWVTDDDRVQALPDAAEAVITFLQMPLTNLVANRRCTDRDTLVNLLKTAVQAMTTQEVVNALERSGVGPVESRATIAWLMKYGLLRTI